MCCSSLPLQSCVLILFLWYLPPPFLLTPLILNSLSEDIFTFRPSSCDSFCLDWPLTSGLGNSLPFQSYHVPLLRSLRSFLNRNFPNGNFLDYLLPYVSMYRRIHCCWRLYLLHLLDHGLWDRSNHILAISRVLASRTLVLGPQDTCQKV